MALSIRRVSLADLRAPAAFLVAWPAFAVLYWDPMVTLGRDWWTDPDAGHGLLLFPVSLWLLWKRGRSPHAKPQPYLGMALLVGAVLLRYLSGLAAELLTMRLSMLGALAALTVFYLGWRQLLHWWLPALLLGLSVPVPDVIANSLALPLQLQASRLGAALLEARHVPVTLTGNIIHLPGRSLFVTEACSGLRSLTSLLALGLLVGGLFLRSTAARVTLIAAAVPVAILLNSVRVFLTGFLMFFVSPSLGEGIMHYSEGWVIFVVAFLILATVAWLLERIEKMFRRRTA